MLSDTFKRETLIILCNVFPPFGMYCISSQRLFYCGKSTTFAFLSIIGSFLLLSFYIHFIFDPLFAYNEGRKMLPVDNQPIDFKSSKLVLSPDVGLSVTNLTFKSGVNQSADLGMVIPNAHLTTDLGKYHRGLPSRSNKLFPRALNAVQYASLMRLMGAVQSALIDLQATWFIFYGTLLGSFIAHNVLPWDDDLNIMVNEKDFNTIWLACKKGLLMNRYDLTCDTFAKTHKLFFSSTEKIGRYNFSWPYVSLVTFRVQGMFVSSQDRHTKYQFVVPQNWIFPMHLRPFSSLWLPAPMDPWKMLSVLYNKDSSRSYLTCFLAEYDNVHQTYRPPKVKGECKAIHGDYAVVWRQKLGSGVLETLKLGDQAVYSIPVEEPFYENVNPYLWKFVQ